MCVDPQPLADALADRRAWIERAERVLEDDLHAAPVRLERGPLEARDVHPVEDDRPRRRLDEAEQQPPDRRLAAPGLPDEAERLAPPDLEAHAVDRPDEAHRALQQPALDREVLDEVPDDDQGRAVGRAGMRGLGGQVRPSPARLVRRGRARPRSSTFLVQEAADGVVRPHGPQVGMLRRASGEVRLDARRAARGEAAVGRQVDEVRHVPGNDGELVPDDADDRDRADQPPRVRVLRARGTAFGRRPPRRSRRRTSPRPGRTSRRPRRGRG